MTILLRKYDGSLSQSKHRAYSSTASDVPGDIDDIDALSEDWQRKHRPVEKTEEELSEDATRETQI